MKYYYYLHLRDEDTDIQRDNISCQITKLKSVRTEIQNNLGSVPGFLNTRMSYDL